MHRPEVLRMSSWLVDYPFADRLYPGALDAVKHVQQWGTPVILSDGDAVFQPRKVERSGLWHAFDGRVLIYIHKEQELDDVAASLPCRSLRHDRRQIAHPVGREEDLGRARHDRVSQTGPLCIRPRAYWPSVRPRISSLPRSAISSLTICLHCSRRHRRPRRCAKQMLVRARRKLSRCDRGARLHHRFFGAIDQYSCAARQRAAFCAGHAIVRPLSSIAGRRRRCDVPGS